MNCQQCREYLSAYLDGALAESQRQALESHCAGCARCAAERDDLQKILKALPQLPQPPVPEDFRRRVWAQIDAEEFASKRKEWRLDSWLVKLPVGALAMAAVVLLVARVSQDTLPQVQTQPMISDVAAVRSTERQAAPLFSEQAKSVSLPPAPTQDKDKMEKSGSGSFRQEKRGEIPGQDFSASPRNDSELTHHQESQSVLEEATMDKDIKFRQKENVMAERMAAPAAAAPQLTPPQSRASRSALKAGNVAQEESAQPVAEAGELMRSKERKVTGGQQDSQLASAGLVADGLEEKQMSSDTQNPDQPSDWRLFVEDPSAARVLVLRILEEFNAFNIQSIQPDKIRFQVSENQRDFLMRYLNEVGDLQQWLADDAITDSTTTIVLTIIRRT